MKRSMIASKAFRYGGRNLEIGDEFQAIKKDARILEAIGKCYSAEALPFGTDESALHGDAPPVLVGNTAHVQIMDEAETPDSQTDADDLPSKSDDHDASGDSDTEQTHKSSKPRRNYRRRDMVAE